MKTHRVRRVEFNNRSKLFRLRIAGRGRDYVVPYGTAKVESLVESVEIDAETGGAGFLWTARDGVSGAMLADEVLWIYRDPQVRQDHLLYELTVEALRRKEEQGISIRALAEVLATSPARVQMLLRPTIYKNKSIKAMAALLSALGADIDVQVIDRDAIA